MGGKHCSVCGAHVCGVYCMMVCSSSLIQAFCWSSMPVHVMCMACAMVRMRARFSSSLSVDTMLPGILESVK